MQTVILHSPCRPRFSFVFEIMQLMEFPSNTLAAIAPTKKYKDSFITAAVIPPLSLSFRWMIGLYRSIIG